MSIEKSNEINNANLQAMEAGVVVQTGDGPLLLNETQVGREGPDLLTYLGGMIGAMPIVL